MTPKIALFAFNGELMCFVHVLLNTWDLYERGYTVKLVIEGGATRLIQEIYQAEAKFVELYEKIKAADLIDCVCQACAHKMGTLAEAKKQELRLANEMSGHPSLGNYIDQGYETLLF